MSVAGGGNTTSVNHNSTLNNEYLYILGTFRSAVAYKVMTECTAYLKYSIDRHLLATPTNYNMIT